VYYFSTLFILPLVASWVFAADDGSSRLRRAVIAIVVLVGLVKSIEALGNSLAQRDTP
jgi:hypothetical protein